MERRQVDALRERRSTRATAPHAAALTAVTDAARDKQNIIEPLVEAARAHASVGEICRALTEGLGPEEFS